MDSLVADVASGYFTLRELDLQLEISQETLASDRDSLQLTQLLSIVAPRPCSTCVRPSSRYMPLPALIATLEKLIQQQENLISALLGENQGPSHAGWT